MLKSGNYNGCTIDLFRDENKRKNKLIASNRKKGGNCRFLGKLKTTWLRLSFVRNIFSTNNWGAKL